MQEAFKALKQGVIDLICQQTGQAYKAPAGAREPNTDEPAPNALDTLALAIDGVGVALTYHADYKSDCAFVFTEFGSIPPEQELAVMRKLLDVNFLLYRGGAPTFTRDPDSGRIVLLSEIPLPQATPASVLHYLRQLVSQALQWRSDHYLEQEPPAQLLNQATLA